MRVAVTGSRGQIVRSLVERAAQRDAEIVTLARPSFDLVDPSTILRTVESVAPDMIVNAAAYTAVDKAESEEALADEINGVGAGSVARAAKRLGIPVIQVSTDYVFEGTLDWPYREDDLTGPINAYGRSKLAGEQAVKEATPHHVILRISWLYSPFGANFVRTMLRLAETRDKIGVVADQIGQPTCALDVADGVLTICDKLKDQPGEERLFGTFHMAAAGAASWADFAEAIFTETARRGRRRAAVARITTEQYPTPARRPSNSRLDAQKLAEIYGVALPPWRNSLPAVIVRLLESI
jgi:dTDP-4-dehydrorhamnose reductase